MKKYILLPEHFNVESLPQKLRLPAELALSHVAFMEYLAEDSKDNVPINAQMLRMKSRCDSKSIQQVVRYLVEKKLIVQCSNHNSFLNKSRRFKLSKESRFWDLVPVSVNLPEAKFHQKLNAIEFANKKCLQRLHVDHKSAIPDMLTRPSLNVNFEISDFETLNELESAIVNIDDYLDKGNESDEVYRNLMQNIVLIQELNGPEHYINRSQVNNRIYTSATHCRKEFRNHFYVDGIRMRELDIASEQPYLLTMVMMLEGLKLKRMLADVLSGCFYHNLMLECQFEGDKASFKKLFYRWLYGPNRKNFGHVKKVANAIRSIYGSDVVNYVYSRKETERYNRFAISMQRLGAEIFLDKALGRFAVSNPNVAILSVHDSVLFAGDDQVKSELVRTIREAYEEVFGIAPMIHGAESIVNSV